ncbi:cell wall protein DAN4-like isoform X2 [Haliotis rufescens]|uniref:cell wall protein DAN4-like isoform X2 n=1 Tax=Haliotis rufescens TaxID=6454 RepID=UPI00201F788F|nr:cell wall protein DAN4-like isoform X2 [Haliotis rufescens]
MSHHTGRISSFSLSPTGAAMPDVVINGSGFDARQDGGMSTFGDESVTSQSSQSSAPYLHVNNMTSPTQDVDRRSPTRCPCQRCLVVGLTILVMILLSGLTATTTVLITNNEKSIGGTAALAATTIGATTDVTAFPNPTATTTTTPTTENTTTTYTSGTATPNITKKYPATTTTSPPATSSSSTTTTPLPTTTSTNRPSTVTTSTSTVTTTTTTSKTTTTTPGCSASRKCHSCTSRNARCPVYGTMAGNDPNEVISCPCGTACYSDVRYDDANTVYRGCWRDFPTWLPESPSDLSCRKIGRHFLCFCHGDRCNTHDMTSYIP